MDPPKLTLFPGSCLHPDRPAFDLGLGGIPSRVSRPSRWVEGFFGVTRFRVYGPAVGLGSGIVKELGLTGDEGGVGSGYQNNYGIHVERFFV